MYDFQMRSQQIVAEKGVALRSCRVANQSFGSTTRFRQDWQLSQLQRGQLRGRSVQRGVTTSVVSLFGFGSKPSTTGTDFYICIDCGYIYAGGDFSKEPNSYTCPACDAPKRRFKRYKGEDVKGRPNNSNSACLKRLKEKRW